MAGYRTKATILASIIEIAKENNFEVNLDVLKKFPKKKLVESLDLVSRLASVDKTQMSQSA